MSKDTGALQNPAQGWSHVVLSLWSFGAGKKDPGMLPAPVRHQLSLWFSQDPKSTNPSAGQQLRSSRGRKGRKARGMPPSPPPSWRHPGLLTFLLSCFSQRRAISMGSCLVGYHQGRSPVPPIFASAASSFSLCQGGDLAPLGLPLKIPVTMTQQLFTEHFPPARLWAGQSLNL